MRLRNLGQIKSKSPSQPLHAIFKIQISQKGSPLLLIFSAYFVPELMLFDLNSTFFLISPKYKVILKDTYIFTSKCINAILLRQYFSNLAYTQSRQKTTKIKKCLVLSCCYGKSSLL